MEQPKQKTIEEYDSQPAWFRYAAPGPPEEKQLLTFYKCFVDGCDRHVCTASEPGYGDYCCKKCYETQGKVHGERCDKEIKNPPEWAEKVLFPDIGDMCCLSDIRLEGVYSGGEVIRAVGIDIWLHTVRHGIIHTVIHPLGGRLIYAP